ncbi:MAG: TolC family protein [Bacteroidetes bacterium]|nr:TolC family protein [Bacteroidota bacterium]
MIRPITFFYTFFHLICLHAQTSMDWESCVKYALDNNLQIKHQELVLEKQNLQVHGARFAYLPNINASGNYTQSYGRSVDPSTNDIINQENFSNSYGINGSITLFQGFVRNNQLQYQQYIQQYAGHNLDVQTDLTTFQVMESYFNVLFYGGMRTIAREQIATTQTRLEKLTRMHALGRASGSEVIEVEARLAQDSVTAVQHDMAWQNALHNLKERMNYPLMDTLILQESEMDYEQISGFTVSIDNILSHAKSNMPDIKALESQLKASQKRLTMIKRGALPELSLYASWNSGYYETNTDSVGSILPFQDQIDINARRNIGISLSIPLFNRLYQYNAIRQEKINYQMAQNQYETEMVNLEYTIYENVLLLQSAVREYHATERNEEKQALAFEIASKKRENGLINIIDLYQVKNQLAMARAEHLRAGLQLFLKYKTVQYYLTGEIL